MSADEHERDGGGAALGAVGAFDKGQQRQP